ncbi:hypothetical protein FGG08_001517 [Glutinoglossum americanum]|uniref:Exocyst complex component Sec3 PIP2-binding N-terminal domain-containing protein n=1 Tax=Glutinoglossum americanum TaxID=1670608 RepID=A0A9P8L2Q1_9PEZI|nr:hypothetical protein FGG08_001517 [Glutinoglossum americanum]
MFKPSQPLFRRLRRLALTTKQVNGGYYKGTGSGSTGRHTKHGGYIIEWEKVRTYVVPNDLDNFELTPFVARTVRPARGRFEGDPKGAFSGESAKGLVPFIASLIPTLKGALGSTPVVDNQLSHSSTTPGLIPRYDELIMNGAEQRSRSQASGGQPGNDARPRGYSGSGMSRAERFEDEKRRIIEYCFSKKDAVGSLLESYITHVRITEDAAYPSSPPPPSSPPDNKKPRVIVVAVRKSGRVRMHKARENVNGSFSIGKTWHLDDLTAIESFTRSTAGGREGEEERKWASGSGFTVTLLKPYFWMAGSPKEKEFFIASLTKIYRKYTGGRLPQLTGFDPREMEQLLGGQGQPLKTGGAILSEDKSPPIQQRPPVSGPTVSVGQRSLGGELTEELKAPLTSPDSRKVPPRISEKDRNSGRNEKESREMLPEGRPIGGEYLPTRKPETTPKSGSRVTTPEPPETEPPKNQPTPPIEASATSLPTLQTSTPNPAKEEGRFRPGLGPMIKKKSNLDVANTFRRAATAYNAFKPRTGGAGDTLPDQVDGQPGEPDGINGVVPAPALLRRNQELGKGTVPEQPASKKLSDDVPDVKGVSLKAAPQVVAEPPPAGSKPQTQAPEKALPKIVKSPEARQPPRSYLTARHFTAIDVDPSLLETRTVEIEPILSEFGWGGGKIHELKVDAIEAGLKREIGGVEAGSWLDHLEQKDERVEAVERMLDRSIAECDELEGLLALYGVELSTYQSLNEDIAFIEAQSEGLQVQTANQKLLKTEVQRLLRGNGDVPQLL